jgi:hypothetical protein
MHKLKVRITRHSDSVKVVWSDADRDYKPYFVHRAQIASIGDDMRRTLHAMSALPEQADFAPKLRDLARAGSELRHKLLVDVAGNSDAATEAAELLQTVDQRGDLTVTTDGSLQVPWALVYEGHPRDVRTAPADIGNWGKFWGSRFRVRTLHSDLSRLPGQWPRAREALRTLLIHHKDEFDRIEPYLSNEERDCLDRFRRHYQVGPAHSWDDGEDRWQQMAANDGVLYVFGHSDGEAIRLGDDDQADTLGVAGYTSRFWKTDRRSATICLINGCWSAAGHEDNGFLTATSTHGFCGFVGAEAPVTNLFALRYSLAFMHLLCEAGCTVEETFERLRRRFWPLSLLYGCYADPRFCVAAADPPILPLSGLTSQVQAHV